MAEKDSSAEKDLLKLIEEPAKGAESAAEIEKGEKVETTAGGTATIGQGSQKEGKGSQKGSKKKGKKRSGKFNINLNFLRLVLPASKRSKGARASKPFDVKELMSSAYINRILMIVAVVVLINFVLGFLFEMKRLGDADRFIEKITRHIAETAVEVEPQEAFLDEDLDLDEGSQMPRNLFGLKPVETEVDEEAAPVYVSALESFRLVGIAIEPNPEDTYAMIENAETQVTYFVKSGDEISGLRVVEIDKEKVMIDVQGTVMELR